MFTDILTFAFGSERQVFLVGVPLLNLIMLGISLILWAAYDHRVARELAGVSQRRTPGFHRRAAGYAEGLPLLVKHTWLSLLFRDGRTPTVGSVLAILLVQSALLLSVVILCFNVLALVVAGFNTVWAALWKPQWKPLQKLLSKPLF